MSPLGRGKDVRSESDGIKAKADGPGSGNQLSEGEFQVWPTIASEKKRDLKTLRGR